MVHEKSAYGWEFEGLQEKITQESVWINISSINEQMPEIEHYSLIRCNYNILPFKKIPARITAEMV